MFGDVLKTVYKKYSEDDEEIMVMDGKGRTQHTLVSVIRSKVR